MTSKRRRCDVVTSHRRQNDVMCLLGICPPPPSPPPPNILNLAPPPPPPQYSKPSYAYVPYSICKTHTFRMILYICRMILIIVFTFHYFLQTQKTGFRPFCYIVKQLTADLVRPFSREARHIHIRSNNKVY